MKQIRKRARRVRHKRAKLVSGTVLFAIMALVPSASAASWTGGTDDSTSAMGTDDASFAGDSERLEEHAKQIVHQRGRDGVSPGIAVQGASPAQETTSSSHDELLIGVALTGMLLLGAGGTLLFRRHQRPAIT